MMIGLRAGLYASSTRGVWMQVFDWTMTFVNDVAILSVGLAIFNLIPIPPLDGSKVLFALLPADKYQFLMRYERYGMRVLMAVLWIGVLDKPLSVSRDWVLNLFNIVTLQPLKWMVGAL